MNSAKSVETNNDVSKAIEVVVSNTDRASSVNKRNDERGRLGEGRNASSTIVDVQKAVTLTEHSNIFLAISVDVTATGIKAIKSAGSSSNGIVSKLESSTSVVVDEQLSS